WRLAFALQEDGWVLRSDVIWSKPSVMPESVTDRPTKSHEYIFLFAKSSDPTFWTHRDHVGCRSLPEPDYRWIDRLSGEEQDTEPADWKTVKLPNSKPRWSRINLWTAHDYW